MQNGRVPQQLLIEVEQIPISPYCRTLFKSNRHHRCAFIAEVRVWNNWRCRWGLSCSTFFPFQGRISVETHLLSPLFVFVFVVGSVYGCRVQCLQSHSSHVTRITFMRHLNSCVTAGALLLLLHVKQQLDSRALLALTLDGHEVTEAFLVRNLLRFQSLNSWNSFDSYSIIRSHLIQHHSNVKLRWKLTNTIIMRKNITDE